MNNVLGDALQKALDFKKNDYSNFVWKGEKKKSGDKYVQETERIIDMSPERLVECWKHCEKMLNNNDPKHLGRYNVLEEVTSQINKCNVELLLRYLENTYQKRENVYAVKRFSLMISLRQLMSKNSEISDWSVVPMSRISDDLPDEFRDVNIADVLDGCTDNLGAFNKQHLTMTFITKMGLWFTKAEENELKGNSNVERLKIAKERLRLPSKLVLRFSEKGLSYDEMRSMLTLPKKQKYSDMTTKQLVTLRNKVLLRLSREIDTHIYNWKRLQKQIELVAKSKNINLND
jgi:plasmid maintenance system antidote protein VapI